MAELPPTQHPIHTFWVLLFMLGCGTEVMLYSVVGPAKFLPAPDRIMASETEEKGEPGDYRAAMPKKLTY